MVFDNYFAGRKRAKFQRYLKELRKAVSVADSASTGEDRRATLARRALKAIKQYTKHRRRVVGIRGDAYADALEYVLCVERIANKDDEVARVLSQHPIFGAGYRYRRQEIGLPSKFRT